MENWRSIAIIISLIKNKCDVGYVPFKEDYDISDGLHKYHMKHWGNIDEQLSLSNLPGIWSGPGTLDALDVFIY